MNIFEVLSCIYNFFFKVTLDALGEMFKEARCIMAWLGDCAKVRLSISDLVLW